MFCAFVFKNKFVPPKNKGEISFTGIIGKTVLTQKEKIEKEDEEVC